MKMSATDVMNVEGAAPKRATLDGCSGFGQLCSRRDYLTGAIAPSALDLLTKKVQENVKVAPL
jgi:hypothetical protein